MYENTSILKKFANSLFNINEFPKYMKEKIGKTIVYALFLCVLCGLISGISISKQANNSVNKVMNVLEKEENKFTIENGTLDINTSPLRIQEEGALFYISDEVTLDRENELKKEIGYSDSYVLFLKDGIIIKSPIVPTTKASYTDLLLDGKLNTEMLVSTVGYVNKFVFGAFIIFNIFNTFISFLLDSLFIAISAMFISRFFLMNFKYSNLYSLTVYASTLPMLVVAILTALDPNVSYYSVEFVVTSLLVFFSLRNIRIELNKYIIGKK